MTRMQQETRPPAEPPASLPGPGATALVRALLPLVALLAVLIPGLYWYANQGTRAGAASVPTTGLPSLRDNRPLVEPTSPTPQVHAAAQPTPAPERDAAPQAPQAVEPVKKVVVPPPDSGIAPVSARAAPPVQAPLPKPVQVSLPPPEQKPVAPVVESAATPPPETVPHAEPKPVERQASLPAPGPVTEVPTSQPTSAAPTGVLARGKALIEQGNIAAARLYLERAAVAGDREAIVLLGGTFDPVWLKQRGVVGVTADIARARKWYLEAQKLGVAEADDRLLSLEAQR